MTSSREGVRALLERAVPFLRDEGARYEDDGSNEPLELARSIEAELEPTPPADAEQRARELLAAEYRRAGFTGAVDDALAEDPSPHCRVTIRAIVAALTQQPVPVAEARGVVVDEAMVERAHAAYGNACMGRASSRVAMKCALLDALTEARNG